MSYSNWSKVWTISLVCPFGLYQIYFGLKTEYDTLNYLRALCVPCFLGAFCAAMIQSFPPVDKTVQLCTEVHGSVAHKHQWSCVRKRDLLNQEDTSVVEEGIWRTLSVTLGDLLPLRLFTINCLKKIWINSSSVSQRNKWSNLIFNPSLVN